MAENPLDIVDVADQCVQDITDLTVGIEPGPDVSAGTVCSANALRSDLQGRPVFSAKNPPAI